MKKKRLDGIFLEDENNKIILKKLFPYFVSNLDKLGTKIMCKLYGRIVWQYIYITQNVILCMWSGSSSIYVNCPPPTPRTSFFVFFCHFGPYKWPKNGSNVKCWGLFIKSKFFLIFWSLVCPNQIKIGVKMIFSNL